MGIHTEQRGDSGIAPSADLERLQAREQPSLSFIQQTEEQDDGRFHLVLEYLPRDTAHGNLRQLASGTDLPLPPLPIQS